MPEIILYIFAAIIAVGLILLITPFVICVWLDAIDEIRRRLRR